MRPPANRLAALLVCAAVLLAGGVFPTAGSAQAGSAQAGSAQAGPVDKVQPPTHDAKSAAVDSLFARWNRNDGPGAAVVVVHDGKVVHRKGYGVADLEHGVPITPATVFDIASVSKQFCGLAIAMLIEQGKVKMDDEVRKFIPWLPEFGGRRILIRHLVHHTSGLRDWPGALRVAGFRFDDVITFAQILEMVRRQRDLDFDPGTRHSYSNTGYNLLAKIVEEVSGVSLAKWTKGHFFDPLGMRDTHFHDDHTRVVRNRAYAYRQVKDGWRGITDNLTAVGSSSLFASADDLGRWVLNFDDDKIAGAAALKRMHTPGTLDDGKQLSYCFGVRRSRFAGLDTVDHTGSWAGFKTCIVRFPAQRFAVVVLANTATVNPSRQAREIARLYLADELRPEPDGMGGAFARAVDAGRVAGERLLDLEGRYHSAEFDTAYTVEVRGARLAMLHFRNEDVVLRQTGAKDRFRGNRSWATTVRFVRDANQAVAALLISNGHNRDLRFDRVADRAK